VKIKEFKRSTRPRKIKRKSRRAKPYWLLFSRAWSVFSNRS
jgi:hypothetical protein